LWRLLVPSPAAREVGISPRWGISSSSSCAARGSGTRAYPLSAPYDAVLGGMSMPRWRRCVRMQRRTGGLTTANECAGGQDRQVRLHLRDERVAAGHVGAPCELEAGECRER
jgi:hypothetical protein